MCAAPKRSSARFTHERNFCAKTVMSVSAAGVEVQLSQFEQLADA